MSDTFAEIKAIIADLLGVDESKVMMESKFREDLEADSLDLVEMIMAFEDKFGAEISDEDAQKITTVLENPTLASQMGKNARRVAESELRWEVLIQRLEEFYFQILNRKGSCVSYSGKQSEDR